MDNLLFFRDDVLIKEKRSGMKNIKYLLKNAGKWNVIIFVLVQIVSSCVVAGVALLLSALLNTVSEVIISGDIARLLQFIGLCCIYAIATGVLFIVLGYVRVRLVCDSVIKMRNSAVEAYLSRKNTEDMNENSAEFLSLLSQNMDTIEKDWLNGLLDAFASCCEIIIASLLLLYINPIVAVISILVMAIPTIIPGVFTKQLTHCQEEIVKNTVLYNGQIRDISLGFDVIRSFHKENNFTNRHLRVAQQLEGKKAHLSEVTSLISGLVTAISVSSQFIIMGITGIFAVQGFVSLGSVVAVTQLSGQVIAPASTFASLLGKVKAAYPVLKAVICDDEETPFDNKERHYDVEHEIELKNVTYKYPDSISGVSKISACFKAGRKYAIIGKSGSGKSTLLKLISGQIKPQSGDILIDGSKDILCDPAMIHQNVYLFDDTLKNNITLGSSYSSEQIGEVIKKSGLSEVVAALPKGLDTPVEENGKRFSGGERQRIAIARALLYGKKLLLVDEATSALDTRMATEVENNLLSLSGVTMIEVTHHLNIAQQSKYDAVFEMTPSGLVEIKQ